MGTIIKPLNSTLWYEGNRTYRYFFDRVEVRFIFSKDTLSFALHILR